jgi:hypothetical protein
MQRSEVAPIFQDVQELASSFASFCVVHAKHIANRAAHACAKFAATVLMRFGRIPHLVFFAKSCKMIVIGALKHLPLPLSCEVLLTVLK